MRITTFLIGLALLAGCGDDPRLTAEPAAIMADGVSTSVITFIHDDTEDGTAVYFETDLGHFMDDGYEYAYVTRSVSGGRVSVDLHAGTEPGRATVTAETETGLTATTSVELTALRPSGQNLSFECESVNIGALRQPLPDLATHCHLRIQDRGGVPIDTRALASGDYGFMAEAGVVNPGIVDDGYGNIYFLYTATGGDPAPFDVAPIDGEPERAGDMGGVRNPRDGLVTIVAWVRGEEGFEDINSNGILEPTLGETFTDIGEPFLDIDDDGVFDAGAGDDWLDIDGDSRYTGPNGRWDEDTIIWTSFKILWTGPLHESAATSRIDLPGGFQIPPDAPRDIVGYLLDQNINPLAGIETDSIELSTGTCYYCSPSGSTYFDYGNARGFDVAHDGTIVANLFAPPQFSITVTNDIYPDYAPETFNAALSGDLTPAPTMSDDYYPPDPISVSLTSEQVTLLARE